jgi:glycosyltransferase involved in cell wall biosynthesis
MDTKVTWLIAVKNGLPYLPETLASIQAQTYKTWEILAWDNGSTDGTVEVLNEWIPALLPGRVVADRPMNLGLSRAEMVKESKTEFCAIIDADDINLPERLEKQVAYLESHPDVAVLGSHMNRLDAAGAIQGNFSAYPIQATDIVNYLMHGNPIAQPAVLFRRSMILEAGNYRHVSPFNLEDYDLWLRVAARFKLANMEETLVNYRVHNKSTTQIAIQENKLTEEMDTRFCEHAPELFGCSKSDAKLLRERRHPRAAAVLKQIALHLEGGNREKARDRMKTISFINAGRALTDSQDSHARLMFAALSGSRKSLAKEVIAVAKSAVKKVLVPGGLR